MPMDRSRYPKDWDEIAFKVKDDADWKCELCGRQCRRPGEPFDTHKRTLTVAHLDHTPENCERSNLMALCPACHLKMDARQHAETRKRSADIVRMREAGIGSPEVARRLGIERREVDRVMRIHARKKRKQGGQEPLF